MTHCVKTVKKKTHTQKNMQYICIVSMQKYESERSLISKVKGMHLRTIGNFSLKST